MIVTILSRAGVRSSHMQIGSIAVVYLCIGLWLRAKTIGEDERGNAERRALFVGLWPPMLWLIGESLTNRSGGRERRTSRLFRRFGLN